MGLCYSEMQLSALEANSRIVVNGEATKQTNRIAQVKAAIDQNEVPSLQSTYMHLLPIVFNHSEYSCPAMLGRKC